MLEWMYANAYISDMRATSSSEFRKNLAAIGGADAQGVAGGVEKMLAITGRPGGVPAIPKHVQKRVFSIGIQGRALACPPVEPGDGRFTR